MKASQLRTLASAVAAAASTVVSVFVTVVLPQAHIAAVMHWG